MLNPSAEPSIRGKEGKALWGPSTVGSGWGRAEGMMEANNHQNNDKIITIIYKMFIFRYILEYFSLILNSEMNSDNFILKKKTNFL